VTFLRKAWSLASPGDSGRIPRLQPLAVERRESNPQALISIALASALLVLSAPTWSAAARAAQEHTHEPAPGAIPLEILQRPVPLREGVGQVHDPVTSTSNEAQAFYDQGVAYLHSYVWIEAARSFNQALRADANLAMAYLGLSRAFSGLNSTSAARAAAEQAQALGSHASAREQRRIELRLRQLDAISDPGNLTRFQQYRNAIDSALVIDSTDPELWLIRGNAEEANAAGRGQHGGESAIPFYEKALELAPNHFGAHHYLVHVLENCGRIEEALKHAEIFVKSAYAVPHAHHMYGHDLRRVGRIDEAIAEFEKADQLEQAYYKTENIPAEYDWHHEHNLDLLSTAYQHQGRMKDAERLMRQAFSIPSAQDTLEFNKKQWPAFLILRGRYDEALKAARVLATSRWDIVRAIGHVLASHAYLAMNQAIEASEEAKAAVREVQGSRARAAFVAPYLESLQGEFFLRTAQKDKGRALLKEVERKLRADQSPDAWTQTLFRLEGIARAAREAGDWELAEYTAKQMLEHDKNYGGSQFAAALTAEHKGDRDAALKAFEMAESLWREADPDLPELIQTRSKIASLRK
jgi:tetratricopeptide (TPR) repeat protein